MSFRFTIHYRGGAKITGFAGTRARAVDKAEEMLFDVDDAERAEVADERGAVIDTITRKGKDVAHVAFEVKPCG